MPQKTTSALCRYRAIVEGKDLPYPRSRNKYVEIVLDGFILHRPISKTARNAKKLWMLIAFAAASNPERKIRLRFDETGYYVVGYRTVH